MIEVNHLTKKYGNHIAVDDLSFKIEKGKIYGFLGPNGAGKSTTMNMITGYIGATAGEIKIDGHDIYKEPEEAKKCIGYLPELPPVYDAMTVMEYMKFVAELKKIPKELRKTQIEEIMDLVKITDMKDRLIQNLSKGYKQRVGLAQAILGYPELIILDEPTVGLDPKQIIEIRELIRNLSENHTIILSSHILSEVREICDEILIISHGKLVASDTPDNLSKLVTGASQLTLQLQGAKEPIEEILSQIDGLEKLKLVTETEAGIWTYEVTYDAKTEPRAELSFELAKANIAIYAMQLTTKSLEDVFLELTADDTAEKEEKKTKEKKGWKKKEAKEELKDKAEKETKEESEDKAEEEAKEELGDKDEKENKEVENAGGKSDVSDL
jgi:ABC-2 type transport system ATP-binding protein